MPAAISIIHGARTPWNQEAKTRNWMDMLERHLQVSGFPDIHQFHWSGGYIDSFSRGVCRDYADHLARIWRAAAPMQRVRIDIFAKSNGGFIAETALKLLLETEPDIHIGTLLRVGIADPRERPDIPLVRNVETVVSRTDALYRIGLLAWRYLGIHPRFPEGDTMTRAKHNRIVLTGLSHGSLNYPIRSTPSSKRTTYDIYTEIFNRHSVQ